MNTLVRRVRETILTLGAVGGVICLLLGLGALLFGITPLIVQSGSMEPTIGTGSLLLTRDTPAADLEVGDVVTVHRADGALVTHRIVELHRADSQVALRLKGDDNKVVDTETYTVERAGRMVVSIPFAGRVAAALGSPAGLFGLGLYAAFLVTVLARGFRRRPGPPRTGGGKRKRHDGRNVVAAGCGAILLCSVVLAPSATRGTLAAWSDTAGLEEPSLAAHSLLATDAVTCANGAAVLLGYYDSVTFGIKHKNLNYDYVLRVYNGNGVQQGSDISVSSGSTALGGTVNATISANQVAGLLQLGSPVYVRVHSTLKVAPTWVSSGYREWRIDTGLLGILLLNGIKCGADVTGGDTTGPTIVFTAPTNGVTADAGAYQTTVRNACGSGRPGCGTVSDAAGVSSVTYQLKRVRSNGTEYFHASSGAGGIWNSDASFESAALSGGNWSFDGLLTTAYFDWNENMAFTLTIRATDNNGNLTTGVINFTLN